MLCVYTVTSFVLVRQLFTVRRRIVSIHEFFLCNLVCCFTVNLYTYLVSCYVVTFDSMTLMSYLIYIYFAVIRSELTILCIAVI